MFIDLRERERNIGVRQKHQLVASHTYPSWGSNPQPFGVLVTFQPAKPLAKATLAVLSVFTMMSWRKLHIFIHLN